ncbi:endonuclease [Thermotomaculum hydrothermale]|uniref:Endonuclease III n=1 Tax=Thermotomaculum hydrothermale TaxID=981385 RepID=A0A7R6SZ29_9BACT|nr:DUF123 domain-containing protein [Thermotomaculum hydrothermale]BBB33419.1 endonuclease [Thermotomaculum hydrothermale]
MNKGIYLIIAFLSENINLKTKSKVFPLKKGYYYYCGSAINGLAARIKRHLKKNKEKKHWHIDFLLEKAEIILINPYIVGDNSLEHILADILKEDLVSIKGFGCGDCKCESHLFYSKKLVAKPYLKILFQKHIEKVVEILLDLYRGKETPVEKFKTPWELLVSCIISLRTKDEVTAVSAERLFKEAPTPYHLMKLSPEKIGELIYPAGFYKTKGKNLQKVAEIIVKEYDGKVPDNKEDLLKLPNVGIKTANLVLANGFGHYEVCVDTHVHRISNRLGFIKTKTPEESEKVLKNILPKKYIREYNGLLVKHGQNICKPIRPLCDRCPLTKLCMFYLKNEDSKTKKS